jgi:hypothetical protein
LATINITKSYADGEVLLESDLDNVIEDVETFLNTTRINDDNIQTGGIDASLKVADGTVTGPKLAADAVTTTKILDESVTAVKLATDSVTTVKILASNVTTAKIADSNVTTAKIADSNVTTVKIADVNVTTAKIADANVTTAKIADGAVTPAKRSSAVYATATGNANSAISGTGNMSSTITATGRPVLITLSRVNVGTQGTTTLTESSSGGSADLVVARAGVGQWTVRSIASGATIDFDSWSVLDTAGTTGSVAYTVAITSGRSITPNVGNLVLTVMEL